MGEFRKKGVFFQKILYDEFGIHFGVYVEMFDVSGSERINVYEFGLKYNPLSEISLPKSKLLEVFGNNSPENLGYFFREGEIIEVLINHGSNLEGQCWIRHGGWIKGED